METALLREISFTGRSGECERLWCEQTVDQEYIVRTPPVFVDNISVGTIIRAAIGDDGELHHTATLRVSSGATVRFVSPAGVDAPQIYHERVELFAREAGIPIGPASFISDSCVAFHVGVRDPTSEAVLDFLEILEDDGLIREWEIGDPHRNDGNREFDVNADAIVRHERPA